ncbi:MAG: DUF58 domain-containing protein [Planctomycetes bacterium]|nr:DUF58 domain-containing protein [Planctomycetota bacterium]
MVRTYQDRLTARGRYLLWALVVLAAMGLDTLATRIYVLFAAALGLLLAAAAFAERPRPRLRFSGGPPTRATAGSPVPFQIGLEGLEGRAYSDLSLSLPPTPGVAFRPDEIPVAVGSGKTGYTTVVLEPSRRGRYELRGPRARRTDPLGLVGTRFVAQPDLVLLVYPRFFTMERFDIPLGRRHQPGGIPLSSNTGDSVEFTGTRDYREGDPIRAIHWRSWARRGRPVVKEYQEEYFCHIAIILDTFLPGKTASEGFEASISMVASIADFFSRSEYIVDILAAGPDIYQVSAGRSLAYLENILDVLACLEPCPEPPFQTIGPALFDRLAQVSTVVAILQDWDPARREFLQRVRAAGSAVRAIVVHDGPTREDWRAAAEEIGEISQMSPADVERALKGGA